MTTENAVNSPSQFECSASYSKLLPEILFATNTSVILTTFRLDRVVILRSHDGKTLDISLKQFPRPMGITIDDQRMMLGVWSQVLEYRRDDNALLLFDEDSSIDACFTPRSSHVTGMINVHDIAWGDEGLWGVNSAFSCLSVFDANHSFVPKWKPPFITKLTPDDKCHLNGLAMQDGKPAYVSSFSQFDDYVLTRESDGFDGSIIDVKNNDIVVDGLMMPHSPRMHNGKLYFCESGLGIVWCFDPNTKEKSLVIELQGYTRGIEFLGTLMLVGTSKLRDSDANSNNKSPLKEKFKNTLCGMWLINLEDNSIVAQLTFDGDLNQIYDISVLHGSKYPEILEWDDDKVQRIFSYPDLS